jgi:hypothetical protein
MTLRARAPFAPSPWVALGVGLVVLLLVEGGVLAVVAAGPPIHVTATARDQGPGLGATITVRTGPSGLGVRAALLSGTLGQWPRDRTVIALDDPSFPYAYGNPSDATSDASWIGLYLSDLGTPARPLIEVTEASGLGATLAQHPGATLLMLNSGAIPDGLLSANSTGLRSWIEAGGTLVWAGGPIGYAAGHVDGAGTYVGTELGWAGQVDLLGFNLTDPTLSAVPPDESVTPTPIAAALGLAYDYPGYGANVSELDAHAGVAIGYDTVAGAGGTSAIRTSIAYLPVGRGILLYFGSGTGAPGIDQLPRASESISQDAALLLSLGFAPGPAAPASASARIGPLGSATIELAVNDRSAGVVAVLTSRISGSVLYAWSQELAPAAEAGGRRGDPRPDRTEGPEPVGPPIGSGLPASGQDG